MIFFYLTTLIINVPFMVLFLHLSFMTRIVWLVQSHKIQNLDSIKYNPFYVFTTVLHKDFKLLVLILLLKELASTAFNTFLLIAKVR